MIELKKEFKKNEKPRKYNTEEEKKQAKRERDKRYYQDHKEEKAQYKKQYDQDHKEEIAEYRKLYNKEHKKERAECNKQYRSTKKGRAAHLVSSYKSADKKYNRGECTLTVEWIVENVFSGQCCHYCGESDWTKLGVDRKDSSIPHTPENCVPCCKSCNDKKHTTEYQEFMRLIGKIEKNAAK